jgi:hypothetical protein
VALSTTDRGADRWLAAAFATAYNGGMASDRCEIFYVTRDGKLRWQWRNKTGDGVIVLSEGEYELFYDCLSAAREEGFTPTYEGMRLFQRGDPTGFVSRSGKPR